MEEHNETGRLFRSLHAKGELADDALIALDLNEAARLSTVSLSPPDISDSSSAAPQPSDIDADFAHLFADASDSDVDIDEDIDRDVDIFEDASFTPIAPSPAGQHRRRRNSAAMGHGIPAWVAMLMIAGVTLLMGVADVIVTGTIGWLTGIALVAVSGYAAATIRPQDGYWAIVSPPLAFLLTTLTVGQFTIVGGGFWVRQGLIVPFTLGRAAIWIVIATAAAAAIVGIRRWRALQG